MALKSKEMNLWKVETDHTAISVVLVVFIAVYLR